MVSEPRQALSLSIEVLKLLEKGVIELVNPQIHLGGGISFKLLPHLKQDSKYQYRVLHFDLSLSPSVFTQCVQVALEPLQWEGMLILPYLDDWLLCA